MKLAILALGITLAARDVRADDLADLEAKGEELAKQSEYTNAIEAFKSADKLKVRAGHACMIGLAYMRRELWAEAELWLATCEKRAISGDQPPSWIDEAEHQLASKLSAARIPAVTIVVEPAEADALLSVSSFAPDESFPPQTIHLAPGKQVIEVKARGFEPQQREISIKPGESQTVTFTLQRPRATGPVAHVAHDAPFGPKVPWIVMGAGVALVGIAALHDQFALQPARDRLSAAETSAAYDTYFDDFHSTRIGTLGILVTGLVTIGVGAILHVTVLAPDTAVTAQIADHGGGILVGWRR